MIGDAPLGRWWGGRGFSGIVISKRCGARPPLSSAVAVLHEIATRGLSEHGYKKPRCLSERNALVVTIR